MDWLDKLEMSARLTNALRNEGVKSLEAFAGISHKEFMKMSGVGKRGADEAVQTQARLASTTPPGQIFHHLVVALNRFMQEHPRYRTVADGQGLLIPVVTSEQTAKHRWR